MSTEELEELIEQYRQSYGKSANTALAHQIINDVADRLSYTKGETSGCRFCGG